MPRHPTSEVGSSTQSMFRDFLEMQSASFTELINAVRGPTESREKCVVFPKYNPNSASADAASWCNTVDFLLTENPLQGSALIIALSASLEGEAAQWLSQVCCPNMQWIEFKDLFMQRFDGSETSAATIFNLLNGQPNVGEGLSSYSNRLVTSLMAKWKNMSVEQIAVSLVFAHTAGVDNRLQRLIFTMPINTRSELQKELHAFSFENKRCRPADDHVTMVKRPKLVSNIKCHYCGKLGHKMAECRSKREGWKQKERYGEGRVDKSKCNVTCFKCGKSGHISTNCLHNSCTDKEGKQEKRVNVCTVIEPKGTLTERGECYNFYFDSGAECSLLKESIAAKFSGKRINNLVVLKGIGDSTLCSTLQIKTNVNINNYNLEILFHVLPNHLINYDIILGREVLGTAFCVTMSGKEFTLSRLKTVNFCCNINKTIDYKNLDTELTNDEIPQLVSILQNYSRWLIVGIPTSDVG